MKSAVAAVAPANCARMNPGVSEGRMPAKVLVAARAKVTEAELNLGYTTIRSPVNGLASRSQQRQGAYINSLSTEATLTYVAAIDPIWVTFSVSQNQVATWRTEPA